jgi:clan AA aspartic protease
MIGRVDGQLRALLPIRISAKLNGAYQDVESWIDTAFDGHLVFSRQLIDDLKLDSLVQTDAVLADGSVVTLDTFLCFVDWFGERMPLQVIANEGRFPLLGTALLDGHRLQVDYFSKEVRVE